MYIIVMYVIMRIDSVIFIPYLFLIAERCVSAMEKKVYSTRVWHGRDEQIQRWPLEVRLFGLVSDIAFVYSYGESHDPSTICRRQRQGRCPL